MSLAAPSSGPASMLKNDPPPPALRDSGEGDDNCPGKMPGFGADPNDWVNLTYWTDGDTPEISCVVAVSGAGAGLREETVEALFQAISAGKRNVGQQAIGGADDLLRLTTATKGLLKVESRGKGESAAVSLDAGNALKVLEAAAGKGPQDAATFRLLGEAVCAATAAVPCVEQGERCLGGGAPTVVVMVHFGTHRAGPPAASTLVLTKAADSEMRQVSAGTAGDNWMGRLEPAGLLDAGAGVGGTPLAQWTVLSFSSGRAEGAMGAAAEAGARTGGATAATGGADKSEVAATPQATPKPPAGFKATVGRGEDRVEVHSGAALVEQGRLHRDGWVAQVFIPGETKRLTLWEVVLGLLERAGNGGVGLVIALTSEEAEARAIVGRLGAGAMSCGEKVFGVEGGDAEALHLVLGKLVSTATSSTGPKAGAGQERSRAGGAGQPEAGMATPSSAAATMSGGPAGEPSPHAGGPGREATQPAATPGSTYIMCMDDYVATGAGRRPVLPTEGALPRHAVLPYFGRQSSFSNLNDDYGGFRWSTACLPQEVVDVLGYDLGQALPEGEWITTVEHGLHFLKFLVHGQVAKAMEVLREENVFTVMAKSRAKGWGFDWRLWDAVAYEGLVGLVRMKAMSQPGWMAEVAAHANMYFVEAASNNSNFGAGRSMEKLFDTEMWLLGHNFSGGALDQLNDEYLGVMAVTPPTLPGPGAAPLAWWKLQPTAARRRDLAGRAKILRDARQKRQRPSSPMPVASSGRQWRPPSPAMGGPPSPGAGGAGSPRQCGAMAGGLTGPQGPRFGAAWGVSPGKAPSPTLAGPRTPSPPPPPPRPMPPMMMGHGLPPLPPSPMPPRTPLPYGYCPPPPPPPPPASSFQPLLHGATAEMDSSGRGYHAGSFETGDMRYVSAQEAQAWWEQRAVGAAGGAGNQRGGSPAPARSGGDG